MLNPEDFKQSLQAVDALGAIPSVLIKACALAKDPNTDLDDMVALLRADGSLAADIIRISNSPGFAPATLHSNLVSAIGYIGVREVIRLVNLSLAQRLFARDLPSYGITASDYWSDSVASALVMEALALHVRLNPEDAYTIGILHAIGRVLINRVIEERRFSIYWDGSQPIQDWERDTVGFDYAEAGARLLEHWHFPPTTCDLIRWQLDSTKVTEPVSLLGMLQFTGRLLALTGANFGNQRWQLPETDPFVPAAGLTPETVNQLVAGCRHGYQRIRQSVDLS